MKRAPLYIETKIDCALDKLWELTQDPAKHELWDLRFSEISYLPKSQEADAQQFLYSTRIGFGIQVSGVGESVATKTKNNGESTSVLKFSSDSKISIIKEGSGYWKYVPEPDGIRFFTQYDYDTRWGAFGATFDKFIFRPLMVWATAWSFDCLKNWLEKGSHPRQSRAALITILLSNVTLALVWSYQGLVPKLLYPDTGEIDILTHSGIFPGREGAILSALGMLEIMFGVLLLCFPRKSMHRLNIAVLCVLAAGALISDPQIFTLPFNPFSLSASMIALSCIVLLHLKTAPTSANCITTTVRK